MTTRLFPTFLSGLTSRINKGHHIYVELPNFVLEGYIFDRKTLFVTFEPAGVAQANKGNKARPGWGEGLMRKLEISCLCIKANNNNWYLKPDLPEALRAMKSFFDDFERIITYGGSMGGFGSLAYADLIGADTVVAINPQSSLDRRIVPWEDRYPGAQERLLDFSHPLSDAVGKYAKARKVLIFSDRWYDYDDKHVKRLMAPNVTYLNAPFVGHQLPEHLAHMGALSYIVKSVHHDDFDPRKFTAFMRNRRKLKRYFNILQAKTSAHPARLRIVMAHRDKSPLVGVE